MPPPHAKPIISGYHCDMIEALNELGVVDVENVINTDDINCVYSSHSVCGIAKWWNGEMAVEQGYLFIW